MFPKYFLIIVVLAFIFVLLIGLLSIVLTIISRADFNLERWVSNVPYDMGRILPRLLFTILFFLQVVSVCSQSDHYIQHYTNENGLPANGVKGIALDKQTGFLWVGTQAGLVRFDGMQFKSFSSRNKEMAASRIWTISKNREGTIYVEDDNFSVYRIVQDRPVFQSLDTFLSSHFLVRGGRIPSVSAKEMAQRVRHQPRSAFLPPWILFHDQTGDSSSFSFNYLGQACHYSAARDSLLYFPEPSDFQGIFKLDGTVYFFRNNVELWEYNDSLMKLTAVPVEGMPAWDPKDDIKPWFAWRPGMEEPLLVYKQDIWKLKRVENRLYLQPLCRGCSPAGAHISSIQLWKEQGIIFLASEVNGLYIVRIPFLRSVHTDPAKQTGKVEYGQAEIEPGIITTASGFSYSSKGEVLNIETSVKFPYSNIYQSSDSTYWFSSHDTIIHYYPQTRRSSRLVMKDPAVKIVFGETHGRIYAISDVAIVELTGDQYQLRYNLPLKRELKNSINPEECIEWRPGVLAIAAEKLVLFDTEKNKGLDTIPIPGLTAKVRALRKYGDYLLIGTYGQGFYMYKNGRIKKMPLDKNGYLLYAHCFMPDDKGYCWISTNRGLFKVSLSALTAAYENDLTEIYYHYFGKNDGMLNTELNGGCQPCALKMSNGLYSFPSMNGVVVFNPGQPHTPPPAGNVFIEEVLADSVSYQPDDNALTTLPYYLKNIRLKIALPLFSNRENIYFSYKLEPYNTEWETQDIIQNNILQFGGLAPGYYRLQLRVRNGFEPNQFAITVLMFRILKPWYQSWWFYLLCFFGFIAMTWGLVKWRTARLARRKKELQELVTEQTKNIAAQSGQLQNQLQQLQSQQTKLEKDNKVKARLIAIISHDILSPLKFLGLMSKKLRDTFPPSDPAHTTANSMTTVTQDLESLSVNMLNWIWFHYETDKMKPERFNLYDLINESTEIASAVANEKGIKLYNDVPRTIHVWQYRQALGVIVYNLAMNAMKHTQTGEVRITGRFTGNDLSLIIRDTGIGMPAELVDLLNNEEFFIPDYSVGQIKKFQFGYRIIKDLLRLVHARMSIESTLDKGTQVTLELMPLEELNNNT